MTIKPVLRTDQPDSKGLCKILIRIHQGNKRKHLTTPYKVAKSQFEKGKVKNHNQATEINAWIKNEVFKLANIDVGSLEKTFQSYSDTFITHCQQSESRSKGTIRYYKGEQSKFLQFTPDLPLKDITPDLIKNYVVWMRVKKNQHNTVWKSLKFLKTLLNLARKESVIRENPFERIEKLSYRQTKREFLTSDEVKKIISVKIDRSNPLCNVRTWFLVQCYTGLRAGDLQQLVPKDIISQQRLIIATKKTDTIVSQPLTGDLVKLLKTAPQFNITLEDYNRQLKLLGALCGIGKKLTSHVARHTYAMRCAEIGISKEVAGLALGHKKSSTTEIYYHVRGERVNKELKKFKY